MYKTDQVNDAPELTVFFNKRLDEQPFRLKIRTFTAAILTSQRVALSVPTTFF